MHTAVSGSPSGIARPKRNEDRQQEEGPEQARDHGMLERPRRAPQRRARIADRAERGFRQGLEHLLDGFAAALPMAPA